MQEIVWLEARTSRLAVTGPFNFFHRSVQSRKGEVSWFSAKTLLRGFASFTFAEDGRPSELDRLDSYYYGLGSEAVCLPSVFKLIDKQQ